MALPRILLLNPWIEDFAAFDYWARPMGLLRFASWFRQNNIPYFSLIVWTCHPEFSEKPASSSEKNPLGFGQIS